MWPLLAKWFGMCKHGPILSKKTNKKVGNVHFGQISGFHKNVLFKPSSSDSNAPYSNSTSTITFICTFYERSNFFSARFLHRWLIHIFRVERLQIFLSRLLCDNSSQSRRVADDVINDQISLELWQTRCAQLWNMTQGFPHDYCTYNSLFLSVL